MGKQTRTVESKKSLKELSIKQLKFLAKKYNVTVRGRLEDSLWGESRIAPTKKQYVTALAKHVAEKDISDSLKDIPKVDKKKRRRRRDSSWF